VNQIEFLWAKNNNIILYYLKYNVLHDYKKIKVKEYLGGQSTGQEIHLGQEDDESFHVLAGHVLSPSQTKPVADIIINWAKGL
jgi:hypothetical protein